MSLSGIFDVRRLLKKKPYLLTTVRGRSPITNFGDDPKWITATTISRIETLRDDGGGETLRDDGVFGVSFCRLGVNPTLNKGYYWLSCFTRPTTLCGVMRNSIKKPALTKERVLNDYNFLIVRTGTIRSLLHRSRAVCLLGQTTSTARSSARRCFGFRRTS